MRTRVHDASLIKLASHNRSLGNEMNPDVFFSLAIRLDNSSLQALSSTPIWSEISSVLQDQYFWYKRTEHLTMRNLQQRSGVDWKSIYYLLLDAPRLQDQILFSSDIVRHLPAVLVLLELGVDPGRYQSRALRLAASEGQAEVFELLLADPRVDPSRTPSVKDSALVKAAENGHHQIVQLLLSDPRMNRQVSSEVGELALLRAVENDYDVVTRLLVADGRIDVAAHNQRVLLVAIDRDNAVILHLLLSDNRVNPAVNNSQSLSFAIAKNKVAATTELLADGRAIPTINNLNMAILGRQGEVVELLLDDGRVVPTLRQLTHAINTGDAAIVALLLRDARIRPTRVYLNTAIPNSNEEIAILLSTITPYSK